MREYQIAQVDVFTDRIFGGNPLAVVLEATGLSDAEMQAIAGELPHAPGTTTFVLSASDSGSDARVRIFTSACELPFSGHSTIGTAYVLARRKPRNRRRLVLEVGIGPVEIEVDGGIDATTARAVVDAGARILVAGSAIFGQRDRAAAMEAIRSAVSTRVA